jgi:hypothetical protein
VNRQHGHVIDMQRNPVDLHFGTLAVLLVRGSESLLIGFEIASQEAP